MTKTQGSAAADDRPTGADARADVTRPRGAGDTAPAGMPNTSVPAGARQEESDSARRARELNEAAADAPMSEGVRQDLLQSGQASDPISGRVYTVDDLSADDREAYRRAHADRTDR